MLRWKLLSLIDRDANKERWYARPASHQHGETGGECEALEWLWLWSLWNGVHHPYGSEKGTQQAHCGFQKNRIWAPVFSSVPWDRILAGTGAQENWLIFKDHLLGTREWCMPSKRSWAKMTGWLHGWTHSLWGNKTQKGSLQRLETSTSSLEEYREIFQVDRRAKTLVGLNLAMDIKGNKKNFYRCQW